MATLHTSELRLRGYLSPEPSLSALRSDLVSVAAEFRPGAFRSGTEREAEVVVTDGDLVEVEFEDGLRIWLTGEEYREKLEKEGKRSLDATGALDVPDTLPFGGSDATSRGIVGWVLKALKVIKVDPAAKSAEAIARAFEDKTQAAKRRGPGFYRCSMATGGFALFDPPAKIDADRLLIFIHGTASSTWGSFGELWSPARSGTLTELRRIYGENVFALDHRSLTESPITNALQLARELGKRVKSGARIDLVSHSRGGLVGELLCRMNIVGAGVPFEGIDEKLVAETEWLESDPALDDDDIAKAKVALAGWSVELHALSTELQSLAKRGAAVNRFVRVACPALGTSLISRRLDRWVQILANVGALATPASPVGELVDSLGDFITAVLHQKTKPQELPGIVAMLPDTGFVRMVNNPTRAIASQLFVIAGDIEPDSIWQRLLTLIADKFYAGEHDLVVNTGSMYGGAPRDAGAALLSYHAGPLVNHFNYFKNEPSAEAIVAALGDVEVRYANEIIPGFELLRPPVKPIAREIVRGVPGPRPIVFVLPGIMGSELAVDRQRIWMNMASLFLGGLSKLQIGVVNVEPLRPYGPYYAALIEYLADSHKVIAFPYDWRLSPEVEAKRLAMDVLRAVAEANAVGKPVRILAHSMGGLIARAMVHNHPEAWKEMAAHPGARLIMLGTPTGGSHSINELLVGQSDTLKKLALVDVAHSEVELLAVIARFPGVLSLLPGAKDGADDYLSAETWARYYQAGAGDWIAPDANDLKIARAFRAIIDSNSVNPEKMLYVAGQAPATLIAMYSDIGGKGAASIRFRATARGDGEVPWDTGIPRELKRWYMPDVRHGNLPSAEEHFPALLDLLETGTTSRLPQEEPVSRAAAVEFDVVREPVENFPDEPMLAAAVLGGDVPKPKRRVEKGPRVRVSVVHGHLKFADHPVMVGHYRGDTIISAEEVLDRELGGRLKQRQQLGLYPGNIGTCEVVLRRRRDAPDRWSGAVVVGLGAVGALGVGSLIAATSHGVLHYAVKLAEQQIETADGGQPREIIEIGMSTLLLGTNAGGVSSRDSVLAVLEGVKTANDALALAKRPMRITQLQFVEIFQSRALQAIDDIAFIAENTLLKGLFEPPTRLDHRRGSFSQVVFKEPEGWWQRLQIKGTAPAGEPQDGSLHFVALTARARADARVVATQRKLVDQFVRQTIRDTRHDPELTRTLFELLLPNAIKERSPDRQNLVLVVDEEAARYPWELLENRWDRSGTPIALNRGLLRQLELSRLRENPVQSLGTSVLVVGDPILDDDDQLALPGARAEATAVADLLERSKRFDVSRQIHARSGDIVRALFAKSYRVIHLAGHGVYEWPAPPRTAADAATKKASEPYVPTRPDAGRLVTGMVLGDGIFLTPAEIEQMRRVPELVFINCCHLGYIEDTERHNVQEATQAGVVAVARTDYNLFAANVATQFIRLGVRAVIAAGWAVDDAAGKTFALAFYEAMVNGQGFGAAVKIARQQTQAAHPYKNTWGAYQCYGDPDYVLVSTPAPREDSQSPFVAIEQVINQIENLTSEIESSGDDNVGAQLKQIASLRKLIDEDDAWRFIGRGWSALGAAYNCAFQFDDAVACYYTALGCEDGGLTVRDLEQLSNAESRAAVAKWITGVTDDERVKLEQQVQVAIQRLQAILDLPKAPKTVAVGAAAESWSSETRERLALLGSACKRKAWIAKNKTPRMEALENMRGFYERAKMLPGNAGDRAYPVINWIVSILVLDWHGKTASAKEESDVVEALEQRGRELKQQVKERRDPWDAASLADLKLITALRESNLDDATVDALAQDYADVKRFASARAYASMREQIEFLASMAALTGAKAKTKLDELLRMLSAGTASPAPSGDVGMPADSDGKTPKQRAPRRKSRPSSTGGTSKKRGRKKRTK